MPTPTLEAPAIVGEARKFLIAIAVRRDQLGDDPNGNALIQLSAYKQASHRTELLGWLQDKKYIRFEDFETRGPNIQRRWIVTPEGEQWITYPITPDEQKALFENHGQIMLPDDECEQKIWWYIFQHAKETGRWPNSTLRMRIFASREAIRDFSLARRHQAYKNLVENGELITIKVRSAKRNQSFYVLRRFAGELANRHGEVFYAKHSPS